MTAAPVQGRMERCLAALLSGGTWVAAGLIGLGLLWPFHGPIGGAQIVVAGIAGFILLPVLGVALMLLGFARLRDYRFVAFAAAILATILLSLVAGLHTAITP